MSDDTAEGPKPRATRARRTRAAESYETGPQQLTRETGSRPSIGARLAAAFGALSLGSGRLRLGRGGSFPQKLIIAPPDLWRGDAVRGADIARGMIACPGLGLDTQTQHFTDAVGGPDQLAYLHGFSWLRDLAAAHEGASGASYTERLIKLWLQDVPKSPPIAWQPEIIGDRLASWIGHAPMLLASTDQVYRSAVLTALARATRQLARTVEKADDGLPLLRALTGMILAGLVLPGREAVEAKGAVLLEAALDRLISADGGFATRSPADMLAALQLLLTLRAAYQARGMAHPGGLLRAIDRLVPALKGLMLGDGALASFHGTGLTSTDVLNDALAIAAVAAKPLKNAAHSGYQRLEGGRAILVMDAGPPPSGKFSEAAHAGTLAFEFSDGTQRLIINCGGDASRPSGLSATLRSALRHTAAHATLVLNNTDTTEIRTDGTLGKGVEEVTATRQENQDGSWIDGVQDGYAARFGFLHRRRVFLKADGMDVRGEDRLETTGKGKAGLGVDVRFHLAPGVTAVATQGGAGAALKLPGGAAWMFRAKNAAVRVEESVQLAASGPRKTAQLVLSSSTTAEGAALNWVLQRQAK